MNLNKVFICGRVTKDIEIKSTPGGQSVCNFSVATNRTWTDKAGAKQEDATFHNIVAWGRTAEVVHQYSGKGAELLVEGRLQTRSWDDKKTGGKRYVTEIVAERIQLGAKPQGTRQEAPKAENQEIPTVDVEDAPMSEDLPF